MKPERAKILTVDDKPENLYALERLLRKLDVVVIQAASGSEALGLALEHDFCVAIVDIQMPEMDGYELVELLRSNEDTATLPVIFVSAVYSDEYHHRKAYEAGAVDFMSKPFIPEILLSKIKVFIDLYQQRMTLEVEIQQRRQAELALRDANQMLLKRALQLETSSQVGQQVVSILDLDQLLDEVVGAIQSQFGYYCVGVWLLNEPRDTIILRANRERGGHRFPKLPLAVDMPRSIVSTACRSGQPYLTNDVSTDPVFMPVEELTETRSELALPLRMGSRPVGVLDIQSDRLNEFAPEDVPVLQMLASQITTAIRNAQLYDAEKQRRWLAESLEQIGRVLASSLDMAEVPNRILEQLSTVVAYSRGSILLKDGDTLRIMAQRGFPTTNESSEMRIPIRPGDVFHQLEETRRPVTISDVTTTSSWQQVEGLPVDRSWLGVPLISKGQVIGMLSLTRHLASMFGAEDTTLVSAFAGQAAVSLENANLYDKLARFNEQLEQLVQQRTAELETAYEKLSKVDKMKSNFITVTAHELRTPLTLIKGYASLLKGMLASTPDAIQFVDGILTGETRLLQVVNSMLDISKIDSQALEVHKASTLLWETLDNVRLEYQAALGERNLTLTMDGLNSLPALNVDPVLMTKLFSHLVGNAVKYTPDGGFIHVLGQKYSDYERGKVEGEWIEIVVSDTGIGIDPAEQEMIFEKFYQTGAANLHSSGKTKFKGGGPGLGLAIARGIVQAHGGHIWVESPGHDEQACPGSSFHVLLPLENTK